MQTHSNDDFIDKYGPARRELLARTGDVSNEHRLAALEERAQEMVERGDTTITAGLPGERMLAETTRFAVYLRRLPDDPDCLRISIGEALIGDVVRYLVIRGDPERCANLLERAARALRASVDDLQEGKNPKRDRRR